jgi:hypothetical protein
VKHIQFTWEIPSSYWGMQMGNSVIGPDLPLI